MSSLNQGRIKDHLILGDVSWSSDNVLGTVNTILPYMYIPTLISHKFETEPSLSDGNVKLLVPDVNNHICWICIH